MSKPYVLIDSGHNEFTAGKRSPDNLLKEYEFNLDVSQRIKVLLEKHGVKAVVQQVKIPDSVKEINERVRQANDKKPDLLVSIHANAWGSGFNNANGWEIFCWKMEGESYELAQAIKEESIPFLGLRNRGIKDGSHLAMIAGTTMPAVLIEHGFYTNEAECELLKTDAFRQKCAVADAKGILKHLNIKWNNGEGNREIVKKRFGLAENTMEYLDSYKYADALYERLAET